MGEIIDLLTPEMMLLRETHQRKMSVKLRFSNRSVLDFKLWSTYLIFSSSPPASYTRMAHPWEKATRMICGTGYIDEYD